MLKVEAYDNLHLRHLPIFPFDIEPSIYSSDFLHIQVALISFLFRQFVLILQIPEKRPAIIRCLEYLPILNMEGIEFFSSHCCIYRLLFLVNCGSILDCEVQLWGNIAVLTFNNNGAFWFINLDSSVRKIISFFNFSLSSLSIVFKLVRSAWFLKNGKTSAKWQEFSAIDFWQGLSTGIPAFPRAIAKLNTMI